MALSFEAVGSATDCGVVLEDGVVTLYPLNRHGDLLFLFPSNLAGPSTEMETSTSGGLKTFGAPNVVEDEIDQYLSKQDGKIYRSRDPQL